MPQSGQHFPPKRPIPAKNGFHQFCQLFVNWITYPGTIPLHGARYRMA
jgi:hypothetical protein